MVTDNNNRSFLLVLADVHRFLLFLLFPQMGLRFLFVYLQHVLVLQDMRKSHPLRNKFAALSPISQHNVPHFG